MDLCYELCLDITRKLCIQKLFIPAMLRGTIDFFHFVPLSLTLTLPGGRKFSAKRNILASFSHTLSTDQDEI